MPLEWCGLTHDGLDTTAQAYLVLLAGAFEGLAGERTIAAAHGRARRAAPHRAAAHHQGPVLVTPRGRQLTEAGWARAAELTATVTVGAA